MSYIYILVINAAFSPAVIGKTDSTMDRIRISTLPVWPHLTLGACDCLFQNSGLDPRCAQGCELALWHGGRCIQTSLEGKSGQ